MTCTIHSYLLKKIGPPSCMTDWHESIFVYRSCTLLANINFEPVLIADHCCATCITFKSNSTPWGPARIWCWSLGAFFVPSDINAVGLPVWALWPSELHAPASLSRDPGPHSLATWNCAWTDHCYVLPGARYPSSALPPWCADRWYWASSPRQSHQSPPSPTPACPPWRRAPSRSPSSPHWCSAQHARLEQTHRQGWSYQRRSTWFWGGQKTHTMWPGYRRMLI